MATTTTLDTLKTRRQRARQPDHVRDLAEQRAAGVRDQARSVRRDFCSYGASVTHHPQGETSKARDQGLQQSQESLAAPDVPAPSVTPGARALLQRSALGDAAEQAIADAGPANFGGRVVIDAMNPLDFSGGLPPKLAITGEDSLGERVRHALSDATVVKAFHTTGNPYFVDPRFSDGQPTMLIARSDEETEGMVRDVLTDFGWTRRSTSAASKPHVSSKRSALRRSRSATRRRVGPRHKFLVSPGGLLAWLANGMGIGDPPRALHARSNTLRPRLPRFEETTGSTLRDPDGLVERWWAIERRRPAAATRLRAGRR
jgi:8-hydroxy-5-deazaflavin:NADPH oxidoreductase